MGGANCCCCGREKKAKDSVCAQHMIHVQYKYTCCVLFVKRQHKDGLYYILRQVCLAIEVADQLSQAISSYLRPITDFVLGKCGSRDGVEEHHLDVVVAHLPRHLEHKTLNVLVKRHDLGGLSMQK